MDEFKELYENLSPNKSSIENVTQLETKVELLEQEIKQLEAALNRSELDKRNLNINYERDKKTLVDNHENLLANISALFKTAKTEIERKNNTIRELRQQLDDFIFRRHRRQQPPQNEVLPPQNVVVPSQSVDDAASAKAAKEDRTVASVIRPTTKNHVFGDREKSSSGDKSPVPARLGARHHDLAEKDKRVDSSHLKCVQKIAPDCRLKGCDKLKYPHSTSVESSSDEFLDLKSAADLYPYCRSDRRIREADDAEYRVHRKVKDRHRYSPYKYCKEDHERSRLKHQRRERGYEGEEYPSRAKRSPYDRGCHEWGDGYRAVDPRPSVEYEIQKLCDHRKSDHASQYAGEGRRREAKSSLRKSIGDRRTEDVAHQKLTDDRRRQSPGDRRRLSPDDRRRLSPGNLKEGGRKSTEDYRKEDAAESNARRSFDSRKKEATPPSLVEDRRRENPANVEFGGGNTNEDRWREDLAHIKSGVRNSIEKQRKEKSIADQKRKSPATLEFGGRTSNDVQRKGDLVSIESDARKSVADRSKEDVVHQKSIHHRSQESLANPELNRKLCKDRRKETPCHPEFIAREPVCGRQKDLTQGDLSARKSIEDRSREQQTINLTVSDRKPNESVMKDSLPSAESTPKQLVANQSKADVPLRKSLQDREQASLANLKFNGQKSNKDQQKESPAHQRSVAKKPINTRPKEDSTRGELDARKLIKDQDREHQVASGRKSNEGRRKDDLALSECSTKKLIGNQSKEDVGHQKSVKNPSQVSCANVEFVGRTSVGSRLKKEADHQKSVKDQRQDCLTNLEAANNPKRSAKKPNENRQNENAANSSQTVVENQVPSASHVEGGYPVEGQMKVVDILAQYGVYATPYKLLNGDRCTFANFKQISPIADTPDHLKALFNNSKATAKVNPIPMINEHRALEGFNSPAKKTDTPEVTKVDSVAAASRNSIEAPPKTVADDSLVAPSPSKLLILNTVTTSPFKNCCIVKVKAVNVAAETAAKEPSTICGTDSTDTEHGVFTRKRRTPVIRHIERKPID